MALECFCLMEATVASWLAVSSSRVFLNWANSFSLWARISCWAAVELTDSSRESRRFSSSWGKREVHHLIYHAFVFFFTTKIGSHMYERFKSLKLETQFKEDYTVQTLYMHFYQAHIVSNFSSIIHTAHYLHKANKPDDKYYTDSLHWAVVVASQPSV